MKCPLVLSALLLVGILMAAPRQGTPKIEDAQGRAVEITNYTSWRAERTKNGLIRLTVRAANGRVTANWKLEGLRLEAKELVMLATQKDYRLISADLSGGISITSRRPSTVAGETQTVDIDAPSASYTTADQKVEISGAFKVARTDSGTGEKMNASGSGGTVTLTPRGTTKNGIQDALVRGPVIFSMVGRREEEGKKVNFTLNGRGNRLTFNDAARQAVLSGNVSLSGDDPTVAGNMTGIEKAVITLDAAGEIDSIDMEGNPGSTVIDPKRTIPPRR
jgi:lipopolysaccharide export system protein LptA